MNALIPAKEIERLLQFSIKHKMIEKSDVVLMRNSLLDLLKINEPYSEIIQDEELQSPAKILENLLDYAVEASIITHHSVTQRDLMDTKIMGILMPRQSEVVRRFFKTYNGLGVGGIGEAEKATDDFYALSQASNYIRMDRIKENLYWKTPTDYGELEITVNLSKPEKDPKEIAEAKLIPQSNYPRCLLCLENVGYAGNINHPARQNHRVIPLTIGDEQWYLQYSPYVYYNEHCIIFHEEHVPMKMSEKTFIRLFDFVDQLPHYFIGSNADLPIVGGSILSHEHFQGGRHIFAMERAIVEIPFANEKYKNVSVGIVKWPMSVIRLSSKSKVELVELSMEIYNVWQKYSDPSLEILAFSDESGHIIPHNTITPIVRKNRMGELEIDLVLRNNRISEKHPYGIFHPHNELHHIKKENIGLIEVMGLAVLPARLNAELKVIEAILQGDQVHFEKAKGDSNDFIYKHLPWIQELINKYKTNCSKEEAREYVEIEIGNKFMQVLMDAGVYKRDEKGMEGFTKFMNAMNFKNIQ